MPMFLDMHELGGFTRDQLISGVDDKSDEFGVTVHHMIFNEKADFLHCICSAPDVESIEKHHMKFNIKCKQVFPIDEIKTDKIIKDEKLKTIGELSSRLAHDIRNPLTVLQTSTDILKSKYPEIYEKETQKFDAISVAINRIEHQIKDVLGYLTTKNLNITQNNLSEILDSALSGIQIPRKITVNKSNNNILFPCDFESMRIVFVNILHNAVQAMGESGKIEIQISRDMENIFISFENSGPSIPDNIMPKIFDPLFTTKQEGTGLGLVSCKNIVDKHGGEIAIKNNPTTFTVILPLKT